MAQRLTGPLLLLDGRDCCALSGVLRQAVYADARLHGEASPNLVKFAEDVRKVAAEFRASVLVEDGSGTSHDQPGSVTRRSTSTERLTVQEAAMLAGVSTRLIRRLAARGLLRGRRCGRAGAWEIDGNSVAAWIADREQRLQERAA